MDSPQAVQSPEQSGQSSPSQLLDSLSKALRPIVYTPEVCRPAKDNWHAETVVKQILHTTRLQETNARIQEPLKEGNHKDITHNMTPECHLNSTITLYEENTSHTDSLSSNVAENKLPSTNNSRVLQRYCVHRKQLKYPSSSSSPLLSSVSLGTICTWFTFWCSLSTCVQAYILICTCCKGMLDDNFWTCCPSGTRKEWNMVQNVQKRIPFITGLNLQTKEIL